MFVKQSTKAGASVPSTTLKPLPTNPADESTDMGENAPEQVVKGIQSMHAALPLELPQTDDEAQQIATSRALATAKDILQKGGTQAEAAEGAKAVARQILREFQLAKQAQHSVQTEEVQVAEMDVGLVSLTLLYIIHDMCRLV